MQESWKPVPGYEGFYEISDQGRCRSVERTVPSRNRNGPVLRKLKQKVLKPLTIGTTGYIGFQLSKEGKVKFLTAHQLVARAFIGPCPPGKECGHLDGKRANNKLGNLRWVTKKENQAHRVLHGTANRGEAAHQAQLTEANVREARAARAAGETFVSIAARYGVHFSTIMHACSGKNWAHVT